MRFINALLVILFTLPSFANPYVHGHDSRNYSLANALKIGTDTNGEPLFLCIGQLFNSRQPGKTWPGYGRCNVAYGGKEHIVDEFEVPSRNNFPHAHWSSNPRGVLTIGRDSNGIPLFLCRAPYGRSLQPGKTWPNYNHCNISYAGLELILDEYEWFVGGWDHHSNVHSNVHHHNKGHYQSFRFHTKEFQN